MHPAEALLQQVGVTEPEEIDLEALALLRGAEVRYRPLRGCEARIVGAGERAIITIDGTKMNRPRQRFSLGHELGHWEQHRGVIGVGCGRADIGPQHQEGRTNEAQANAFAANLLLPEYLFRPLCHRQALTLTAADGLAARFQASLTATAIRMVQMAFYPGMVVCYGADRRLKWKARGPGIPFWLKPHDTLDDDTQAFDVLRAPSLGPATRPQKIGAESWIDHDESFDFTITEHAAKVASGAVIALLWWEDEGQLAKTRNWY